MSYISRPFVHFMLLMLCFFLFPLRTTQFPRSDILLLALFIQTKLLSSRPQAVVMLLTNMSNWPVPARSPKSRRS